MRRIRYKKVRKVRPNQFEYTGVHKEDAVSMQLFEYDDSQYREKTSVGIAEIGQFLKLAEGKDQVLWLNIHGLHDTDLIREVGGILKIENYIISDILNTSRRSRVEELDDIIFFSIKSILHSPDSEMIQVEQISFLLRDNLLVSFQEKKSDFFSHIRERIRKNEGTIRRKGNDYLMFLMLEAIMENFYISIENDEIKIEKLLTESKLNGDPAVLEAIEKLRENLNFLKRSIVPLRDALYTLKTTQEDAAFNGIEKVNYIYYTRLHQKSLELLDQIDYDMTSLESASNVFFSAQNQRMNQIMKTLTIFSVIFMPLTFIVGVYGMNFQNMPELKTDNGYFYTLGIMFVIAAAMVVYFKKKDWF